MTVHLVFDIFCLGLPLCVLFICVNMQYFVLTPTQKKECPSDLQQATLVFLGFMYAALLTNCCCSPCIAASSMRPGQSHELGRAGTSKTYTYREDDARAAEIYINKQSGTGYSDEDRLLSK